MTDPISDMLARIRNAHLAFHKTLIVPNSKVKVAIADILKEEGYIADYEAEGWEIKITLRYMDGKPIIAGMKKISKPGRRVYVNAADIPRVQNGLGICILSTSKGMMEGLKAKQANVGGELVCEVW
jgi:small subunit ribosomal protein S8